MIIIKSKVNHPFIYFLMEPNVVFVYKIDSQNYVTVSDVSESGEWKTFELIDGDTFDTFNHEVGEPLEGKGYFINQDDINNMVNEINKHIQKYRHFHPLFDNQKGMGNKSGAVHIVSPEFAAGSLRVGLERPKFVIGFPDFFSIGPLWKLDEKIGQTYRNEWLKENINFEVDDYEYENKFINTLREIEDIPNQVPIYIWYGNNAGEQTGIRFLLYLLRDKTNDVFLLNSTELYERYISSKIEVQPIFHTGQIEPENLRLIFEKNNDNMPLSNKGRIDFQREWKALSQTKEILRVWYNDEIKVAPESHYDFLIINTLRNLHNEQVNKDFIKTGHVIGEIFKQMDHDFVSDFFLEYRIRHLIYSGVLELKGIPKSIRHYGIKIRE